MKLENNMLDSLKNAFVVSRTKTSFTTYSRLVFIRRSYNITKQISVGLFIIQQGYRKTIPGGSDLIANINLGNALSTSLSYTAENYQYDNLGAGLAFRAGIAQFYLVSDRIPISWNKISDKNNNIILPANWNTFNLRLGMNLVFGNKSKEKSDRQ